MPRAKKNVGGTLAGKRPQARIDANAHRVSATSQAPKKSSGVLQKPKKPKKPPTMQGFKGAHKAGALQQPKKPSTMQGLKGAPKAGGAIQPKKITAAQKSRMDAAKKAQAARQLPGQMTGKASGKPQLTKVQAARHAKRQNAVMGSDQAKRLLKRMEASGGKDVKAKAKLDALQKKQRRIQQDTLAKSKARARTLAANRKRKQAALA